MTDQSTLVASAGVAIAGFEILWIFVRFGPESEDHGMVLVFTSDSVSGLEVDWYFMNLVKVLLARDQRGVESDMTRWRILS